MPLPLFQEELCELISIRSLSGEERPALELMESFLQRRGWRYERLKVSEDRWNIFVAFGEPQVVFTTHLDVVPAPDRLFTPRLVERKIYGRGSCDAKGVAITMVHSAGRAIKKGLKNFGLLFVVGEEDNGIGARTAAQNLKNRGIKFIINGEPTEGKLMRGHKGALEIEIISSGTACHSGYPHLGFDANKQLIEILNDLSSHSWPKDTHLGETLFNFGVIQGGVAPNIISPKACARILFRAVSNTGDLLNQVRRIIDGRADIRLHAQWEPVRCITVDGFETDTASYCTDIPNFAALKALPLLYGPGSIECAHTDDEHLDLEEAERSIDGYVTLLEKLDQGRLAKCA